METSIFNPRVLLFFFSLHRTRRPKPTHTSPWKKPAKLDDFCLSFLVQEQDLSLEIPPPFYRIFRSALFFLLTIGCSCFVGVICSGFCFREFPCTAAGFFSPCQVRFCSWKILVC
ncbi:hypothetical protein SLEP1_g4906 [Rubroshorea leprosula]|uniref:Transmembrane protein n=1 Tax=Rubroshorea leprosula TaxID=152421 RepID=A0AAV5HZ55_9ROSI|nr:hypothetical protein SLEP1_g4906 [Rubroshorea leprosula]